MPLLRIVIDIPLEDEPDMAKVNNKCVPKIIDFSKAVALGNSGIVTDPDDQMYDLVRYAHIHDGENQICGDHCYPLYDDGRS